MAQRIQFPQNPAGLRPIQTGPMPTTGTPAMVPINPATQAGVYPSTGPGSSTFDPYSGRTGPVQPIYPSPGILAPGATSMAPGITGLPPGVTGAQATGPPAGLSGVAPGYTGPPAPLPGAGQSGIVGSFPYTGPAYTQPGVYPNSSPSALFPGSGTSPPASGGLFSNIFGGGSPRISGPPVPAYSGVYPPAPANPGGVGVWNPPGTIFSGNAGYPGFIRFFQGPRFRHAWIHGDNDPNAVMINDSDFALAFAIPNFLFSTQPVYLLPSFSLHQWDGPHPNARADLPAIAYSAFLDAGWQSDPARILGAELGLRVGMFTDFDTATSESLRIQGRGIGRIRLTPRATLKLGVLYLDRNRVKLLPAGGILWQPNPETRFDLFFPEPKLSHYLSTVGTADTWWYVGGYYGGGSWTIQRTAGTKESIDINDLRLVLGMEWGRNDQLRLGRRFGFLEVGYVFDRELLYKNTPLDNLSLQDSLMIRAGFGY